MGTAALEQTHQLDQEALRRDSTGYFLVAKCEGKTGNAGQVDGAGQPEYSCSPPTGENPPNFV